MPVATEDESDQVSGGCEVLDALLRALAKSWDEFLAESANIVDAFMTAESDPPNPDIDEFQ